MANTFSQTSTPSQEFLGVPTISSFELVTSAPMQISENVRFHFPIPEENPTHDYFVTTKNDYDFNASSGAVLVDGSSYSNLFVPISAQFIAPNNCYLKNIVGYITSPAAEECADEIHISFWRKSVDIGGTSDTPMYLLFTQVFTFAGNEVHQITGGNTLKQESLHINEGEGVIISIRLVSDKPCLSGCYGDVEMVFESIDNQATQDNFRFATEMTEMGGVNENVIAQRDVQYKAKSSGLPIKL